MELNEINLRELIESETGNKFNRQGYINCPFHGEKTPSLKVKFFPDANKERFHCFGCKETGDALDLIMKLKNIDLLEAKKYLGLPVEQTATQKQAEEVKKYIDWEIQNYRKGQKLLGLFEFTSDKNEILYFKAKFLKEDGKKTLGYYHIENNKVIPKRGCEEVPYNLYRVLDGIANKKVVIIVEGEKDANTLNLLLRNSRYVATSLKGVKDFTILTDKKINIYICSDTGKAGDSYKWEMHHTFFKNADAFKFVKLPGIKYLGDNKDVTDWLDAGHDKRDLLNAFDRSLDLKDIYELQQNKFGIYRKVYVEKKECYVTRKLTDFQLIDATRIRFVDEDQEGVKLILKSSTGAIIEKSGPSTVFDDVRAFKNFLGTMDLAFTGKSDDLTDLKMWINKYFAIDSDEIHQGVKIINRENEITMITNDGSISSKGIDYNIKSDGRNNAELIDKELISKEELKDLMKYLLKFATPDKTLPIIGTAINNMAAYQNEESKNKLHHLLIVGESGSGKSTILENVIAPILNYPKKDIKSIGLITSFALIKGLSDGNYPVLFDEFKPSALDRYKIAKLSETFRNLYDRATVSRGDKSFKSKDFVMRRPLMIVGEESYPNHEKALIERSCIVYLSRRERTEEHGKAMKYITDKEGVLNKLGRSLINTVLSMTIEEYKDIRQRVESRFNDLYNRPLTTAINIATGIEIFNVLLKQIGLKELKNYEVHITANIKDEILDDGKDTNSIVEQMIILYNSMIEDGRAFNFEDVVRVKGDGVFIRTSEMLNQIHDHCNKVGAAELIPLKLRDFRKQAMKSGYLESASSKVMKVGNKSIRYDTYNPNRLMELNIPSIIENELGENVTGLDNNVVPFK